MTHPSTNSKPTILLLADRRKSRTARMLKNTGYHLVTTFTPDHAVAICVNNNKVNVVVLDQEQFIETEGWSVAKSLKMIRRNLCVILVVRGRLVAQDPPDGVDAIVTDHDDQALLKSLEKLLDQHA
jgi:PleD family two-component response regulator